MDHPPVPAPTSPPSAPARAARLLAAAALTLALTPCGAWATEGAPPSAPPSATPGAAPPSGHLGWAGELALEFGGDNVAKVYFVGGGSQDVRAGQGGTLALGGHYRPASAPLDLVATVGYKFVTTAASNSDIGITRFVVQLVGLYDPVGEWWIGGGPVLHTGTKFDGGGLVSDVNFDPSIGLNLQAGWRWIGLTGTLMTYQAGGASVNASAVGLSLRFRG